MSHMRQQRHPYGGDGARNAEQQGKEAQNYDILKGKRPDVTVVRSTQTKFEEPHETGVERERGHKRVIEDVNRTGETAGERFAREKAEMLGTTEEEVANVKGT